MIVVHVDGSCLGNPGPGGWAVVILETDGSTHSLTGSDPDTTNNCMELMAALVALRALPADVPAVLFSDSEYVVKGLNAWLPGWERRGWKTAKGQPIANPDLWRLLSAAQAARPLTEVEWVRAHTGNALNEAADRLARAEAEKAKLAGSGSTAPAALKPPAPFGRMVSAPA